MESRLDKWLENNHTTLHVDTHVIHYLRSLLVSAFLRGLDS